jgi:hypothetical protein
MEGGMTEPYHERDRQIALAEARVLRLRLQLALAHVDHLGLLLRDNLIAPWGARAALADLYGRPTEEESA